MPKRQKNITLIAHGYNSKNKTETEDEVVINILEFKTNKWFISVVTDDGVMLSGFFYLSGQQYIVNGDPDFTGTGINERTGEKIKVSILSNNNDISIFFYCEDSKESVDMPLDCFYVHKDAEDTKVLFNDKRICYDINDPGWKVGTTKQLKKCLLQNKYLKKL